MSRYEEIAKKANELCNDPANDYKSTEDLCIMMAEWADEHTKSFWHDADKEQPKHRSTVIAGCKGRYELIYNCSIVFEGRKWAYLEDILPTEEEQQ